MFIMKVTTIVVFLIPMVVATHHHRTLLETILKSKGNLFSKVDDKVQNVMNNLFDSLNLEENFIARSRIRLLLTMHYDLKSISEKNYDAYENMKDAAKSDTWNKATNKVELFELIEEILDEKYFNMSGVNNENKTSRKHTKHKLEINTTEYESDFADSKEFMKFIQDFIIKVDNLSEKDFTKRPPAISPDEQEGNDDSEKNLRVWRPPAVLQLDYVNDTDSRRIFRGQRSKIRKYPFVVSVHLMGVFTCAGSIISLDLIISAASCLQLLYNNRFYRENPRSLFVRVGSDYYARGGERIQVIETYFHPSYDPKTLANNLVLLRLHKQIKFRKKEKKIKRILIDRNPAHLPANTDGIVIVGWGSKKQSQIIDQFQRMLVAQLDIYQVNECAEIYSKVYVTDKHFCAGFISAGGGACNKDLGGPGIVNGKLVGVVSFGSPVCGSVDSPTVFTKIGHYAKWVDSIIKKQAPVLLMGTTLYALTRRRPYRVKHTRPSITPVSQYDDESFETTTPGPVTITQNQEQEQEQKQEQTQIQKQTNNSEDLISLQKVLQELAQPNNSFLRDLLYGDQDEDFHDIFKPAEIRDPMQHPLVNKSLFPIPGIHTFQTGTTGYVTIPFIHSSIVLPNIATDPTATTTDSPSRMPMTTEADQFIPEALRKPFSIENEVYSSSYDITSREDSATSYEDTPMLTQTTPATTTQFKTYGSYEELSSSITKPKKKHHHHHRDKQFRQKAEDFYDSEIGVNAPLEYYDSTILE